MSQIATTKMSSRGQIVIPEAVRQELGLEPGSQFMVIADRDEIMLKVLQRPSKEKFSNLLAKTHRAVEEAGITPTDLDKAIKADRNRKKAE